MKRRHINCPQLRLYLLYTFVFFSIIRQVTKKVSVKVFDSVRITITFAL